VSVDGSNHGSAARFLVELSRELYCQRNWSECWSNGCRWETKALCNLAIAMRAPAASHKL